jgi:hypothetical protein
VTAESIYEAAALALAAFRSDDWIEPPGPGSRLDVEAKQQAVRHSITVTQIQERLESSANVRQPFPGFDKYIRVSLGTPADMRATSRSVFSQRFSRVLDDVIAGRPVLSSAKFACESVTVSIRALA